MKISLVLLTYNRSALVEQSVSHNLINAGHPIDEIIWIDNGSTDEVREFMPTINPDITVLHKKNLGVAKGYNAGYKLASGTLIARPGTDMLMPPNWLARMVGAIQKDPKTGIVAIYSQPMDRLAERRLGDEQDGLIPAVALGSQLFKQEMLGKIGCLPESFGLYGFDDVLWETASRKVGYHNYYITGLKSTHLGDQDEVLYPEYRKFKDQQVLINRQRIAEATLRRNKNTVSPPPPTEGPSSPSPSTEGPSSPSPLTGEGRGGGAQ